MYDLDIPMAQGRVPFHKTIYELVKRVSQIAMPEGELSYRTPPPRAGRHMRATWKWWGHLHTVRTVLVPAEVPHPVADASRVMAKTFECLCGFQQITCAAYCLLWVHERRGAQGAAG
jgi:hypothetical protein